ncbi:MAG: hypothetical protein LBC68_11685 [Prevotellaceae bacterium]|nr:hypothetical protein [Prevotellaceae bacterium]
MSVERRNALCISRELPTVFHVINSASRETYSYVITFLPTFRSYGTGIFKLIIISYGKFEFSRSDYLCVYPFLKMQIRTM